MVLDDDNDNDMFKCLCYDDGDICAAARRGEFISLNFSNMVTECSYDYVFVYDGRTYNSRLLGSFSGGTKPDVLVATSQYVSCTMLSVNNAFNVCRLHTAPVCFSVKSSW